MSTHRKTMGFTLLDTLVATAVVGVGMVGIFSMLIVAQKNYLISSSRLTGVMLAQEGVEWIRNVRDTNELAGDAWNSGLAAGTYRLDVDENGVVTLSAVDENEQPVAISAARLRLDDGLFNHQTGEMTRWYRTIALAAADEDSDGTTDGLTVTSRVQWKVGDTVREQKVTAFIYDWR